MSSEPDVRTYEGRCHCGAIRFCRHCGIYPFHDGTGDYEGRFRVNLGCVDGVDALALEVKMLDGRSF